MKILIKFTDVLIPIFLSLGLAGYFMAIVLKFPLVGIEVAEKNNQWIVNKVYENGWAWSQPIEEGDKVELVNGKNPGEHSTVRHFNRVEMAKSITLSDQQLNTHTFSISYSHLDIQYMIYLFFPFLFAYTNISLSIFLYQKEKKEKSAVLLIYFLLAIGICYLSASVSARGDMIGRISNTITLSGSIILFMHFLKRYLLKFNLEFIKTNSLRLLYFLNFIVVITTLISLILRINLYAGPIQLCLFLLLICYLLFQLIRFSIKNKNNKGNNVLKILWITLFSAFSPFVFLYVLPHIISRKEIVSAEITAVFLIIIPIVFVYLQLAEKLFDFEFLLNRLRYYALLSFPFSVVTVFLVRLVTRIELFSSLSVFVFFLIFMCTTLFLYIKEYIDYKIRHHLFSQKSNFDTSLYTFFQRAKYETKVNSLITNLMNEIRDVLMVKKVFYFEVITKDDGTAWLLKNKNDYPLFYQNAIEKISWDTYQFGSLHEMMDGYGIIIGGDRSNKDVIFFGLKRFKTSLNIQERIWLETLAYFSSILLENFQLIEGLFEKIENYKEGAKTENVNYPYWFSRIMFSLSEKERTNLSIDLHDSVLQEQLQLLRAVEKIKGKASDGSLKNELAELKERMLDNIHLIRETCNELRPPFLNELGIIQSIQNLIEHTKLRCDFILKSDLDHSIQVLDKDYELTLYRVVQELLNNAMKHSLASEVKISLRKTNQVLYLSYSDNGKGIDMKQLNDSFKTMGIFSIKERIKSIGGTIEFVSAPGKGMRVSIEIKTGGNEVD
ncbi:hypothetical protein FZD47_10570 [Bacillus infantis]|uniref:Histidine kinase domain-containing protein n=1 Tax=Bacillus infantis TaxID=324767 RepID=A0A5D4SMJ3_9BACI|nr:ATP-binding protein [Bacillus infantis]TYS63941.1 hypothetical protein FZD47_10570 [Bacillus infantis]